jgi:hypothetical protein
MVHSVDFNSLRQLFQHYSVVGLQRLKRAAMSRPSTIDCSGTHDARIFYQINEHEQIGVEIHPRADAKRSRRLAY